MNLNRALLPRAEVHIDSGPMDADELFLFTMNLMFHHRRDTQQRRDALRLKAAVILHAGLECEQ